RELARAGLRPQWALAPALSLRGGALGCSGSGGGFLLGCRCSRDLADWFAAQHLVHVVAFHGLDFLEMLGQRDEVLPAVDQDLAGPLVGHVDDALHFGVDLRRDLLRVVALLAEVAPEEAPLLA